MTETRRPAADDAETWLRADRNVASGFTERKLRLFCAACCRRVWHLLPGDPCRRAVEVAERFADGRATAAELTAASNAARQLASRLDGHKRDAADAAAFAAEADIWGYVFPVTVRASKAVWIRGPERELEEAAQADLLREVLRTPLPPAAFPAEWRTTTVVALARHMYESLDFSAMPILADALQDAGCDNDDILSHCRGPARTAAGAGAQTSSFKWRE